MTQSSWLDLLKRFFGIDQRDREFQKAFEDLKKEAGWPPKEGKFDGSN